MERIARSVFRCRDVSMEDVTSPLNVFVTKDGMDSSVMSVSNSGMISESYSELKELN